MISRNAFFAGLALGGILTAASIGAMALLSGESAPFAATQGAGGRGEAGGSERYSAVPAVNFATATPAKVGVTLNSIGVARSSRSIDVTSEVAGIVTEVAFTAGAHIKKGDLLIRIDDREQRIALERARAQYPIAKRNAERFSALAKADAGSALEADNARSEAERLAAEVRAAEFELSRRAIRAPFDGVAGLTDIEAGDMVSPGQQIVSLDDTSSMVVSFDVPQEAARDVAIGQSASILDDRAEGGRLVGMITAIDSRVDPLSRTLTVEASFENPISAIRPGATFEIATRSEGADALRLPGIAVQWDRTGSFVWTVDGAGNVRRVAVAILQREADDALIRGALMPGDTVIAEGADRVRPGMSFPAKPARRGGSSGVSAGGLD
ncbi:MAG: efflux RND transporter periplasmic adaptor subunit [Alphaproteobacteria bacterium]|nr:efflux RND transporter periplasmic adaptor subunit [Alphaproteobacteria bacterium]